MDFLIVKRVDLNAKDKEGCTPLHYAAKNNNEIAAERLLKEWSVRVDVGLIFSILNFLT